MDRIRERALRSLLLKACVAAIMSAGGDPSVSAQEVEGKKEGEAQGRHTLALFTGNSWIPQERSYETGEKQTLLVPVYGLDYEFRLSERWSIASYNDITLTRMAVEDEEGVLLERENAVLVSLGAAYELFPRFAVEVSFGAETDAHGTLRAGRFGCEYAVPLPKHWKLGIGASYVNKDVYDVFSLGLVIGMHLGKPRG